MTPKWQVVGFLCETTLVDQDQRTSLIGIMPGKLSVPAFPAALGLGAFVKISPLPPPQTPIKVEVSAGGVKFVDLEATSVAPPPDASNEFGLDALHINISRIVVTLGEAGVVKMTVSVGEDAPELVTVLRLELAEPLTQDT